MTLSLTTLSMTVKPVEQSKNGHLSVKMKLNRLSVIMLGVVIPTVVAPAHCIHSRVLIYILGELKMTGIANAHLWCLHQLHCNIKLLGTKTLGIMTLGI
jgi:hypothetical protein